MSKNHKTVCPIPQDSTLSYTIGDDSDITMEFSEWPDGAVPVSSQSKMVSVAVYRHGKFHSGKQFATDKPTDEHDFVVLPKTKNGLSIDQGKVKFVPKGLNEGSLALTGKLHYDSTQGKEDYEMTINVTWEFKKINI